MSLWALCTCNRYQLISSDWVYWFLSTAYSIGAYPFKNEIHFLSTNAQLSWSFLLPHAQHTYWSVNVEWGFAYKKNSGPQLCRAPSAEPYWACLHQLFFSRHQMAPSFHIFFPVLWWMRCQAQVLSGIHAEAAKKKTLVISHIFT